MAPDRTAKKEFKISFVTFSPTVQCPKCHVTISQKGDLPRHMRTHAGEKLHCPYLGCHFKTVQKPNLTTHLRQHGEGGKSQCPDCEFFCNDPGSLTRHRKRIHGYQPKARRYRKKQSPSKAPDVNSPVTAAASNATPDTYTARSLGSVVKHTLQHTRDSVGQCDAASGLPQVRAGFHSEARMILPPPGVRTSIASGGSKLKETSPSTGISDSDTFFPLTPPPRDSDDKHGPVRTLPYPISYRSPGVQYKERAPGVVGTDGQASSRRARKPLQRTDNRYINRYGLDYILNVDSVDADSAGGGGGGMLSTKEDTSGNETETMKGKGSSRNYWSTVLLPSTPAPAPASPAPVPASEFMISIPTSTIPPPRGAFSDFWKTLVAQSPSSFRVRFPDPERWPHRISEMRSTVLDDDEEEEG